MLGSARVRAYRSRIDPPSNIRLTTSSRRHWPTSDVTAGGFSQKKIADEITGTHRRVG